MVIIEKFALGYLQNNAYLIYENGRSVLIDAPKGSFKAAAEFCKKNGIALEAVYLTHGHFDHILDVKPLKEAGIKVYINEKDEPYFFESAIKNYPVALPKCKADGYFKGGDVLSDAGFPVRVIETPGHTKGGVCFIIENYLFSGDTLFKRDYGRTDIGGNFEELKDTVLNKLFALPFNCTVFPGHGESTTLDYERKHNPMREE